MQDEWAKKEFVPWAKTYRLFTGKGIVVTEKIDGTNACIVFDDEGDMFVQSRRRIITPESDNYGFARWATDMQDELFYILGPGRHYGEWWGQGIQRGYGMNRKVFSVFNTRRWYGGTDEETLDSMDTRSYMAGLAGMITAVPTIYSGHFSEYEILKSANVLRTDGSMAARLQGVDYDNAEGVCIFFPDNGMVMKHVFDNDDKHKWEGN